jgi:photolyase PhrII
LYLVASRYVAWQVYRKDTSTMPAPDRLPDLIDGLPEHLHERCRALKAAPIDRGRHVLYWMHHAARGHENPALDVAIALANRLQLPLLVYQGLSGTHRFNNDRHHRFILEGARDAHREISRRGLRAVFHLAIDPTGPSPLSELAAGTAVLVAEDYPAPPFPAWTARLAQLMAGPVVAVDCSCMVPMQQQPRQFDRAYEFRRHNRVQFAQRLALSWQDLAVETPAFDGPLPFDPLDLEQADLAALCARCAIDHSVPPVPDTPGGSNAGYARWDRFRREGLDRYADLRNDAALAWPQGVSRMSPYLHHGQVSPLRIAREAFAHGGPGAQKFLDELLVWRELAYNFCFHTPDPESLGALPNWAKQTLLAHRDDPRPKVLDNEALARSRTGDTLWDLAQTSLRVHGELHNNLRMTWAKAIPQWRADPQQALRTLIDLNHRFALDGSDPNSYGGLLWTLGLFDRPFPEQAVTGRLRSRSTQAHAERLDIERYRTRVCRPAAGRVRRIGVIGAGLAGLAAARTVQDQGHQVTLFEKSRGPGGRASTRRHGEAGYDHGAQYFTARDPAFRDTVSAWLEAGVIAPWPARMATFIDGRIEHSPDEQSRYVGVPGMNALGKYLASDLTVQRQTRVAPPEFDKGRWRLCDDDGAALGAFDALIVAVPAPQAVDLLREAAPALAASAATVDYAPMWAAMLQVGDADGVTFDGLFVKQGPVGWAARNHTKPGRLGKTWVVHATADWTRAHLDLPAEAAAEQLGNALAGLLGVAKGQVTPYGAHRWLYSLVEQPLDVGALWAPELQLAACGDWCQGARIEGAYLSGIAAAGQLLGEWCEQSRTG